MAKYSISVTDALGRSASFKVDQYEISGDLIQGFELVKGEGMNPLDKMVLRWSIKYTAVGIQEIGEDGEEEDSISGESEEDTKRWDD